ncbi:unnamed protein product [Rotaria socialis]|uniref:Uncharacterized protein n=1 Tax=Rotaria socialis TaxID=392032 RepID=A0A820VNG1_9BILA|nr:unnamed protein product [Rotaria socialis]CAF4504371.1 unnamed protein product [Rotaria socialis]
MANNISNSSTSKTEDSEHIESNNTRSIRLVENFLVIWLDSNINETSDEYHHATNQLQHYVNTIQLASDQTEYIDLIKNTKDVKVFIIVSGTFGIDLADVMQVTPQIYCVYVYCAEKKHHEEWAKHHQIIKGVFTDIETICDALRRDVRRVNNDLIPISILQSTSSDQFDQLFACSLILKEFLINSACEQQTKNNFMKFCRSQHRGNSYQSNIIKKYQAKPKKLTPIQWYTRECFLYSMLNRALRLYDIEILTQIKFFVQEVNEQIQKIYSQSDQQHPQTVYHGQNITNDLLSKLQKNKKSLISFNTFLMANMDENLTLDLLQQSQNDPNLIAVLFKIAVDRSKSSYPFIILDEFDYYQDSDRYVLFALNTTFQIENIEQINEQLWEVRLILAKDTNKKLNTIKEWIETKFRELDSILRFGKIMIDIGKTDKAEEFYKFLLENSDEEDKDALAYIHHSVLEDDPRLCKIYAGIGAVQRKQGRHDRALGYFNKVLDIHKNISKPNPSVLAFCLYNIGLIFYQQKKYEKARKNFEKALRNQNDVLSCNRDLLTNIHSSLSMVFNDLGEYQKAMEHAQQALEIATSIIESNNERIEIYQKSINQLKEKISEQ